MFSSGTAINSSKLLPDLMNQFVGLCNGGNLKYCIQDHFVASLIWTILLELLIIVVQLTVIKIGKLMSLQTHAGRPIAFGPVTV